VISCCDNGPRVPLGYAPVLQYTLLFFIVFYSKGRVLKLFTISSFDLSVVSFSWQSCCSSKSFSHFWNTRALVTAARWSLRVSDLSITLSLKYMSLSWQIVTCLMRILRLIVSNWIVSIQSLLVETPDVRSARTVSREFCLENVPALGLLHMVSWGCCENTLPHAAAEAFLAAARASQL